MEKNAFWHIKRAFCLPCNVLWQTETFLFSIIMIYFDQLFPESEYKHWLTSEIKPQGKIHCALQLCIDLSDTITGYFPSVSAEKSILCNYFLHLAMNRVIFQEIVNALKIKGEKNNGFYCATFWWTDVNFFDIPFIF